MNPQAANAESEETLQENGDVPLAQVGIDERLAEALGRVQEDSDLQALTFIVENTREYVWRFALRLLHDEKSAEDLTQQVFLQFTRQLSQIREPRTLRKWLGKLTLRGAADFRADPRELALTEDLFDVIGPDIIGVEFHERLTPAELAGLSAALNAAIRQINPRYQACLRHIYLDGKTPAETAIAMGVDVASVHSYRSRALVELAKSAELKKWL